MILHAEEIMTLSVNIAPALDVGTNVEGHLRVIPITGGTFEGERFSGKILQGGADWNVEITPDVSRVHAVYCIQENDGTIISVDNFGFIDFQQESVIRTTPRFTVRSDNPKYKVFQTGVFVGALDASRSEDGLIVIRIYKMR